MKTPHIMIRPVRALMDFASDHWNMMSRVLGLRISALKLKKKKKRKLSLFQAQ